MALCPVWTEKVVKQNRMEVDPATQRNTGRTVVVPQKKLTLCGRKPEVYLRAFYGELHTYRKNEGKFSDLFGLCRDHGPKFTALQPWNAKEHDWHRGALSGLRGTVERVEMVTMDAGDLAELARQDVNLRTMAAFKSTIKRQMGQRNAEKLTLDHWRQVFEECIEEFVAEQVMES